jgi:GTP-binding protein YchF
MVPHEKVRRTSLEFVDVAGLVEGAAREGRGRGAEFLSHIRSTDAIVHVIRLFHNPDVVASHATLDPVDDAAIVNLELILADLTTVERRLDKTKKLARVGEKDAKAELEILEAVFAHLDTGKPMRQLSAEKRKAAEFLFLLTDKPMLYVANVSEAQLKDLTAVDPLAALARKENAELVVICGDLESEIATLEDPQERTAFLADMGLKESGLDQLVRAGYKLLDLLTFYTLVGTEIGSWTVTEGTPAPRAAGKIHSDMEKGFIRADVMAFEEFLAHGSEAAARSAGQLRSEGRDYVVKDGDIIRFKFKA